MLSSLELYSEEKQIEIMDAANQIMDLIRVCVQSKKLSEMESDQIDLLEKLFIADNGLLTLLSMGHGLQKEKVKEICDVLTILHDQWRNKEVIPKKAAELFADFYFNVESSLRLYDEEKQIEIMDAAYQIRDRILQCVQ